MPIEGVLFYLFCFVFFLLYWAQSLLLCVFVWEKLEVTLTIGNFDRALQMRSLRIGDFRLRLQEAYQNKKKTKLKATTSA